MLYFNEKGFGEMTREIMDRISELSRKSRSVGLNAEEKEEQRILREEYLADIRRNFKATLDSVEIIDEKPLQ